MGADRHKEQAVVRSLELAALPHILKRGQGLEMELMIDRAYGMEPPRNPRSAGWGASGLVTT